MTISVIIPVYNVEKYVRRSIESVLAQESADFNIECLIIDDCSPDDSMSIVRDTIDSYKGTCILFHIIRHEKNMGLSAARQRYCHGSDQEPWRREVCRALRHPR